MTLQRSIVPASISTVADDEVAVIMSTAALARDGHILVPQGCQLAEYRRNPIVLWSHNPDLPIGNARDIASTATQISARIKFAPLGISTKADEIRGLMKAGVIQAVSVGFDPIEMTPIDPAKPRGGQRISVWTLLELSAVSVPADPGAIVTARALREGKVLSGANADTVRQAHDLAQQCHTTLATLLAGAGMQTGGSDAERRSRQLAVLALAQDPVMKWQHRQIEMLLLSGAKSADIDRINWNSNRAHVLRQIDVCRRSATP
jgi:HK97 family phage prohead protease